MVGLFFVKKLSQVHALVRTTGHTSRKTIVARKRPTKSYTSGSHSAHRVSKDRNFSGQWLTIFRGRSAYDTDSRSESCCVSHAILNILYTYSWWSKPHFCRFVDATGSTSQYSGPETHSVSCRPHARKPWNHLKVYPVGYTGFALT